MTLPGRHQCLQQSLAEHDVRGPRNVERGWQQPACLAWRIERPSGIEDQARAICSFEFDAATADLLGSAMDREVEGQRAAPASGGRGRALTSSALA